MHILRLVCYCMHCMQKLYSVFVGILMHFIQPYISRHVKCNLSTPKKLALRNVALLIRIHPNSSSSNKYQSRIFLIRTFYQCTNFTTKPSSYNTTAPYLLAYKDQLITKACLAAWRNYLFIAEILWPALKATSLGVTALLVARARNPRGLCNQDVNVNLNLVYFCKKTFLREQFFREDKSFRWVIFGY